MLAARKIIFEEILIGFVTGQRMRDANGKWSGAVVKWDSRESKRRRDRQLLRWEDDKQPARIGEEAYDKRHTNIREIYCELYAFSTL